MSALGRKIINDIVKENDITPEEIAMMIMQSEPFMWLMAGSNHQDSQIAMLRPAWEAYKDAGGATWGKPATRGGL